MPSMASNSSEKQPVVPAAPLARCDMCVFMYLSIYVCVYTYIHVCIYIYKYIYMYIYIYMFPLHWGCMPHEQEGLTYISKC